MNVAQTLRVFLLAFLLAPCVYAQAPADARKPAPVWDIVSIKPHRPGDQDSSVSMRPATYTARNITTKNLIADAYNVKEWLIFGLPKDLAGKRWDIDAKVSDPDMKQLRNLSRDERRGMVVAMLATSFGLKAHRESKAQPVFEMTVLPGGPKFAATPIPPLNDRGEKPKPDTSFTTHDGVIEARGTTMANLAANLSYQVERTIVDKTGLDAEYGYNVELRWTPEDRDTGGDNGADAPPLFVEALREQLGLKLESSRADVPTLVVDDVHAPDAN